MNLKEIAEGILNREYKKQEEHKLRSYEKYKNLDDKITIDGYKMNKNLFLIPKDMPEIINNGSNQLIMRINEEYVAKLPVQKVNGHYLLSKYPRVISESVKEWRDFGFSVPKMDFYHMGINGKIHLSEQQIEQYDEPKVLITRDLSENNKYIVITYEEKAISNLRNFKELKEEFDEGMSRIMDIQNRKNDNYALHATGHMAEDGKIDEAITHMFLVQIDSQENTGKIFPADMDHLFLYKLG